MKAGRLRDVKSSVRACTFNSSRAKTQTGFPNFLPSPLNSCVCLRVARAQNACFHSAEPVF